MAMIPWLTGGGSTAPSPSSDPIGPYGTPTPDPTSGIGIHFGPGGIGPADISAWQAYFASPGTLTGAGGGTGAPQTVNQLVQTGSQFSPTIPWLSGLNLPIGALGIGTSSDPKTQADLINASPFAGDNPSNPYYNLILNQMAQGTETPTYSMQQVQVPGQPQQVAGGGQYAGVFGGQLIGNPTPEEQSFANAYGIPVQLLPDFVNQSQVALQQGQPLNLALGGTAQNVLLQNRTNFPSFAPLPPTPQYG